MSNRELCRRLGGHDWKTVGIYAQCQTCGVSVRWRQGGGDTGYTNDELADQNEHDRQRGERPRNS